MLYVVRCASWNEGRADRCAMIKRCQEILILQICGHILRSHDILGEYIGHVYDITLSEVLSEQIYNMYSITRLYIPDNAA